MKRVLLSLMVLLLGGVAAFAQRGLNCYPVFQGEVVPARQMVSTEVRGSGMAVYRLDYYRGVQFQVGSGLAGQVARLVEADAAAAGVAETERVGEFLTYALFQPKGKRRTNRYVCYQARPVGDGWKVTLLYLEGPATLEDLRTMFEKQ